MNESNRLAQIDKKENNTASTNKIRVKETR